MKVFPISQISASDVAEVLSQEKLAVLSTDTIYGIHTKALSPHGVEKVYTLKGRNEQKPFIILISSLDQLELFSVSLTPETEAFLKRVWPGPVSVILPCRDEQFAYLHRGFNSLAFRFPKHPLLLKIINQTGPLISTSANRSGEPSSTSIDQAIALFGEGVDLYVDAGELPQVSSTVVKIDEGKLEVIREGQVKIEDLPKL